MKVAVFYLSYCPGVGRQRVMLADCHPIYIRAEVTTPDGSDEGIAMLEALDRATPQAGEHVMNSHVVQS